MHIKDICGHTNGTTVNKADTICGKTFERQLRPAPALPAWPKPKNKQELSKGGHTG